MKLFERILCPIDFSEDSVKALQWTQFLAKRYGSDVTILHVMEPYPTTIDIGIDYDRYHAAVVRDMEAFLAPLTIPFHSMQSSGVPAQKISSLAMTLDASAVVMATRGLRGAAHRMIGSTAESVIRHSPVPVLTVSPNVIAPNTAHGDRVLLPVPSLDWPASGYMRLRRIIRDLEAQVTMMHVVQMNDHMFSSSSFNASPMLVTTYELAERKKDLEKIGFQIDKKNAIGLETVLQFGEPAKEIVQEAQPEKYGWVLMGAKRHKLFARFRESTAYNVISLANIPVLTIRI